MTIAVGDRIPSVNLTYMAAEGPTSINTDDLFAGKRTVMFALPGAYTPTCSAAHLPGFVVHADALASKGIQQIVCMSVNDAFVMDAWGKQHNATGNVMMIADGNADFAKAVGLDVDLSERGMGIRSQRYAMVIDDGVVELLRVEQAGKFEVSDAESILRELG